MFCLLVFTYVYTSLPMFSLLTRVYFCLPSFSHACLPIFTPFYSFLPIFTCVSYIKRCWLVFAYVYLYLTMFTTADSCFSIYTILYSFFFYYVYRWLLVFI